MKKEIQICTSLRCRSNDSEKLLDLAANETEHTSIQVSKCGCLGGCSFGPNIQIIKGQNRKTEYTVDSGFLSRKIKEMKDKLEIEND